MLRTLKSPRRLAAVAVFAIVAMSAFGFAAQNNFNGQNRAGNGTDAISGYTITNISYSLQGSNPQYLDEVSFTLNQPASEVQVRFDAGTWIDCGASGVGNAVTCTIPNDTVLVNPVAQLEVSAVS
jgi:hypothetical protein